MDFTNPVPSSGIPKFHEASPQRSPRDSEALTAHWRKQQKASARVDALTRNMALMNRNIARLRRSYGSSGEESTSTTDTVKYYPGKIYNSPVPTVVVSATYDPETPNYTLQTTSVPSLIADAFADWLARNTSEQYDILVTGPTGIPSGAKLVGVDDLAQTLTIDLPITATITNQTATIGIATWNCFRVRAFSIFRPVADNQPEWKVAEGTDGLSWADNTVAPAVPAEVQYDSNGLCPNADPDNAGIPPYHPYVDFFVPGYNAKTTTDGGYRWVYIHGFENRVHVSTVSPGTTDVSLIATIDCDYYTNPDTAFRVTPAENKALIRQYVREDFTPEQWFRVYLCGDGVHEAGYYLLRGLRDPDQTA